MTYGKVTVRKISRESFGDFVVRKFEIEEKKLETSRLDVKTSFILTQFQLLVWPDRDTPHVTASLIELVGNVNKVQMGSVNRPMIVMCK